MKQTTKLNPNQLALIDDLLTSNDGESKVLQRHGVSERRYRKWSEQEAFVEELRRGIRAARQRNMLKIARHAAAAVEALVGMTENGGDDVKRKACMDLLSLQAGPEMEGEKRRGPRVTKRQASRILKVLAEKEQT